MWYSTAILIVSCSLVKAQLTPSPSYAPPPAAQGTQASTGSPNSQWSTVLGNSLWFYDAQRSGRLEQGTYGNRVAWRNDSCLEDGSDYGVDLSGGWFDAGDYIKATFPLTFTLTALSWGALTHGRGYDSANQGVYLDGTLRWGFDWMMKAHPSDDVLFMQVGSSDVDNAYWGGDQNIPTPRPAYPVNSSSPGTDAWASAATAFAMGSILYSAQPNFTPTSASSPPISPSIGNATYSSQLLSHAEALYRTAKNTTPYTLYASSLPAIKGAYGSSDFGDDLSISALTLALATNQSSYYQDAYQFYQQFALSGTRDPWNWDSQKPALYVLFVETALTRPSLAQGAGLDTNLTGWRTEAENYFDRIINGNLPEVYITKAGLLYYEGDSRQASLNPAMAAATLMLKYAPMASTSEKGTSYTNFAQTQIDYLMGKNPMNAVYLVGSHPNSPQSPHSAPASGGTSLANLRTDPPVNERVLYGAMVGGPLSNDRYWDWRDDWVQNEVALDYNAMIPTLAAMQLLSNASDPFYVSLQAGTYSIPSGNPCDDALPCSHSLSGGAIAGIVLGCIAALLLVGLLWWIVRRRGIR